MLRTAQNLLANALVHTLGQGKQPIYFPFLFLTFLVRLEKTIHPVHTADYAVYGQIITWFFDTPSAEAPFSVHHMLMALAGKELGTDVGQWFGPSVAARGISVPIPFRNPDYWSAGLPLRLFP
jgi:cysteine protease ATG4